MPNIGPMELIIILIIALVVFGPKRLPELGRSLGSGMREFKDSVTGKNDDEDEAKSPRGGGSRKIERHELPAAGESVESAPDGEPVEAPADDSRAVGRQG